MTQHAPLGLLVPLEKEAEAILHLMKQDSATLTSRIGGRDFHAGYLFGSPCVLTLSRIGKVAAATAAAGLIHAFNVGAILNMGVAGGVAAGVNVGDVVIADALLQHDLDARPIFPRFEVPLTGMARFATAPELADALHEAARAFFAEDMQGMNAAIREQFSLHSPRLHRGLIVSGDCFVNADHAVAALRADIADALAVEMESAAVAQVCHDHGIACAALRVISDRADDNSHVDFAHFLDNVASFYSEHILRRFMRA